MLLRAFQVVVLTLGLAAATHAAPLKFQEDDWVAECDVAHETADRDCSIIGVFRNNSTSGPTGSYSLLVDLTDGVIAIVGKPAPRGGAMRIDKSLAHPCTGDPYCIFASPDVVTIRRELETGSVILLDVASASGTAHASLSARGYQIGLAKLRAEGWRAP